MREPSVLDYLKSKIAPWKYPGVEIPKSKAWDITDSDLIEGAEPGSPEQPQIPVSLEPDSSTQISHQAIQIPETQAAERKIAWPWLSLFALALALIAQYTLEPGPNRSWIPGLVFYSIALLIAVWAYLRGEWEIPPFTKVVFAQETLTIRTYPLLFGILLGILSFAASGGNRFTLLNILLLILSLVFLVWAFWIPGKRSPSNTDHLAANLSRSQWTLNISAWTVVIIVAFVLAAFFRFYKLSQVPAEMNSDHAEKILDVIRVLDGQTMIFFPTNGGREALQFYLVGVLHKIFGIDLEFMALKIITTMTGYLSLPFIYLLGKDLVNRRVGLLAMLFAAVAYWPNVVSRVGLRLPFYIFFTAATLYFLLKGIRSGKRNYFILTGVILGISLYGYSADRILPLLVLAAVGIFLIHKNTKRHRKQVIISTIILIIIAGVIFLPMLRYMVEDPNGFLFRTLSRMGTVERPLPDPALEIFLKNLGKALLMFFWNNGEVWPVSVPHRPALDIISGALFALSIVLLLVRYIQKKNWLDLFWLVSIPILLLPSVMSLAFPKENPNLYRTAGAMIPVFLILGIALDGLIQSLSSRLGKQGPKLAWGLAIILVSLSAAFSYHLVFDQYYNQYKFSAWNSTEMGRVVQDFTETAGEVENVWVMAYPHWVDTRLIGMIAGYPLRNFVLFPEELGNLPNDPGAKLFLIKPEDNTSISMLFNKYPDGWMDEYTSAVETKNFLMYLVPPASNQ